MQFDENETVKMIGDLDEVTATEQSESTYRIKYVMNTSLIFDTYSYLTLLQDPNPAVFGGVAAQGFQSDIEFEYLRSTEDSIILRGKKYQNNLYLVKATAEQKADYEQGGLLDKIFEVLNFFDMHTNNYINIEGISNKVSAEFDGKIATIQYANERDSIISIEGKYNFDLQGINFPDGIIVNGVRFTNGVLKDNILTLYDAQKKSYIIAQNPTPIIPLKLLFNYNRTYKGFIIRGQMLPTGVSSSFNAIFNGMVSRFNSTGRTIESLEVRFSNTNTMLISIWYLSGTSRFLADASFKYTYQDDLVTLSDFTPAVSNGNWNTRATQIGDFATWWQTGGPFKVDWVASSDPATGTLGGLYKTSDMGAFFYGTPNQ